MKRADARAALWLALWANLVAPIDVADKLTERALTLTEIARR